MNCEKCRWYKTTYCTYTNGVWTITVRCLLGGCDGSQYEQQDGAKMDEAVTVTGAYCDRNICKTNELNGVGCDECVIAQNYNLEDDDSPCQNCEVGE